MANKTTTQPTMDIVGAAKSIGETIVALQVSNDKTVSLTDTLQENAKSLREAGVKFGKSVKTCTWRQTISDTIVALCHDKKAQKTCMNYVTSFVKAVNEGTKFSLSDSKGTGKAKGKATEKDETIFPILAKLFSHADFGKLTADLETMFDNDEGHLKQLIQSMLESEGYKIEE